MKTPVQTAEANPAFFSTQVSRARRFYLNLKPSPKAKLAVVCGGLEHCAPDYRVSRRTFPFFSVEYVAAGNGKLQLNGVEHPLQAGSVFAYGPGIPQEIGNNPNAPLIKYFIDFSGVSSKRLLARAQLKPGAAASVFPPGEIMPLFDEIIRNGLRGTPGAEEICARLLEALLLKLAEARAPLPGRETPAFATYQHCREHINQHFLRLRSVEQVARECHLDNTYLCRLFQRFDHQSPYRRLVQLKMNHAAERLQLPGAMVKQVAEETGFANQFHFSRVFKSVFGIPPRALARLR
jgi:AraC-like DNA-binding protein/quercetin dioxygenase-like cupin family protein